MLPSSGRPLKVTLVAVPTEPLHHSRPPGVLPKSSEYSLAPKPPPHANAALAPGSVEPSAGLVMRALLTLVPAARSQPWHT